MVAWLYALTTSRVFRLCLSSANTFVCKSLVHLEGEGEDGESGARASAGSHDWAAGDMSRFLAEI